MATWTPDGVKVYRIGLCFISVCAVSGLAGPEVARQATVLHPTGLDHGWKVSAEEFSTGEPNPSPCNKDGKNRRHWLLEC